MRFRGRRIVVIHVAPVDALLAESEQLDRELRRMVRRLETFTDHLLATTAAEPPPEGSPSGDRRG